MAYPGAPTHVHNAYRYGDQYAPLSTWWFLNRAGEQLGWIFDDTTPDLTTKWIPAALEAAKEQSKIVVVLVGPGDIGKHHAGCVNILEAYYTCTGLTLTQWLREITTHRRNHYAGYVMQRNYGWQDNGGGPHCVPSRTKYWIMRHALAALRPAYGLWDF
jgi:hypothetical protein